MGLKEGRFAPGLAMKGWEFKETSPHDAQELISATSRRKTSKGLQSEPDAAESFTEGKAEKGIKAGLVVVERARV